MLTIPKARRRNDAHLEALLDHVGSKSIEHMSRTRSHNEKLLALANDRCQHLLNSQNVVYLTIADHNMAALQNALVTALVVDEHRTRITALQTNAMSGPKASLAGLALLYHNNPVLAYVPIHTSNDVADTLVVVGTDSSYMLQLLLGKLPAALPQLRYHTLAQRLQLPQHIRLLGIIQLDTALHQCFSQNNAGRSTIASLTRRPVRSLLHHPHSQVLDRVNQLNSLGHSNTILRNRDAMRMVRAFNQYRLATRTQRRLDRFGQLLNAIDKLHAIKVELLRYFIHSAPKLMCRNVDFKCPL